MRPFLGKRLARLGSIRKLDQKKKEEKIGSPWRCGKMAETGKGKQRERAGSHVQHYIALVPTNQTIRHAKQLEDVPRVGADVDTRTDLAKYLVLLV